jgi:hypothetical protein
MSPKKMVLMPFLMVGMPKSQGGEKLVSTPSEIGKYTLFSKANYCSAISLQTRVK